MGGAPEDALDKEWFADALGELPSIGLQTSATCLLKATEEQPRRGHLARHDGATEHRLLRNVLWNRKAGSNFSSLLHRTMRTYQSSLKESQGAPGHMGDIAKRINDDLRRSVNSMRRKLSLEPDEVQADFMQKTEAMLEHKWHEFCWSSLASDALVLFDWAEIQQQQSAMEAARLRDDISRSYANRTHRVPDRRGTRY